MDEQSGAWTYEHSEHVEYDLRNCGEETEMWESEHEIPDPERWMFRNLKCSDAFNNNI